jgi:hypothetical protein
MTTIVETEGEPVKETTEPAPKPTLEDIPKEDLPAYTVAGAIEWIKQPANADRCQRWVGQFEAQAVNMMHRAADTMAEVGGVMVDILEKPEVETEFIDGLLDSFLGR